MFRVEKIDLYVRETKPARFASALGKKGQSGAKAKRVTSPLCHVRMQLRDEQGNVTFGTAADRLSVRWLDKRPGRAKKQKLTELVQLIGFARSLYLKNNTWDTPFDQWLRAHSQIMREGDRLGQEKLTSSFASALFERAMIDGVCRTEKLAFWEGVFRPQLGFRPNQIHKQLNNDLRYLRRPPRLAVNIRHTVGLFDPLDATDWPTDKRLQDGLPETLEECIKQQGIRYFKVKISGDVKSDLKRLARIWELLPTEREPTVTLDANEAFEDLELFDSFVRRLEKEQLGLFQHIAFIEQPLRRDIAFSANAAKWLKKIGKRRPVVIDESDGSVDSFRRALESGYAGTSHKNCKGVFKSLAHLALVHDQARKGKHVMLSGEDLQNLPVVPLHQDFTTVSVLGLSHCERNGHHYNFGLSMLSDRDKENVTRRYKRLYEKRGDEWFLRIRNGQVALEELHEPGFGVVEEPDWAYMIPLDRWIAQYPDS